MKFANKKLLSAAMALAMGVSFIAPGFNSMAQSEDTPTATEEEQQPKLVVDVTNMHNLEVTADLTREMLKIEGLSDEVKSELKNALKIANKVIKKEAAPSEILSAIKSLNKALSLGVKDLIKNHNPLAKEFEISLGLSRDIERGLDLLIKGKGLSVLRQKHLINEVNLSRKKLDNKIKTSFHHSFGWDNGFHIGIG